MSDKKIRGLILVVLSVLGGFYSINTYTNDTSGWYGYTYEPPFTTHEVIVILIGIASLICFFVGLSHFGIKGGSSYEGGSGSWTCKSCGTSNNAKFEYCLKCGSRRR